MSDVKPLPCIRCGKQPVLAVPAAVIENFGDRHNQPYEATVFYSHGQYGSTVWDEMGRDVIEINVCDKCLLEEAAKGNILRVTVHTERTQTAVLWVPSQLEELIIGE
jgi:hypothetical protein